MMKDRSRRARIATMLMAMLITGVVIGLVGATPASAHVSASPTHLWSKHIKKLAAKLFYTKKQANARYYTKAQANARFANRSALSSVGTINASANPVTWTKLKGVPIGLADGIDSATAGTGLTGGTASGSATLSVDFGTGLGEVAQGNSVYTKTQADATFLPKNTDICAIASATPYSYFAPWCALIYSASIDTVNNDGATSSIAIGSDGLPVVSHHDDTEGALLITHCGNAACTSGTTTVSVDAGVTNVGGFSSIAIGADGLPVVSYYDATNFDLRVTHCGNAACTSGNTSTGIASVNQDGWYTSIAIGADGLPVISYVDNTDLDLRVTHCDDVACASSTSTSVDTTNDVGYFTSIAIGADGLPVVSYLDMNTGDLRVTHCGNVTCNAGNTITPIDTTGVMGQYTSIAIGADGLPIISHQDFSAKDLRVTHCGNAACSSGNTSTSVGTVNEDGQHTSIAIGADGLPIISHYDAPAKDLRVTHCGNAACSSGNTSTSVDTANNVGEFTSIAIGADGLPIISHYDATSFDLRITHGKMD